MLRHLYFVYLGLRAFVVTTALLFAPVLLISFVFLYLFWVIDTAGGNSEIHWPSFMPWISVFPAGLFFYFAWCWGREIEGES